MTETNNLDNMDIKITEPKYEYVFDDELKTEDKPKQEITDPTLTADGVLTIEEQLRLISIEDEEMKTKQLIEEEKNKRRDLVTMVKTICLVQMGKEPLLNTSYLTSREKELLVSKMNEYVSKTENDLRKDFADICNEKIFSNPKVEYTNLPMYRN